MSLLVLREAYGDFWVRSGTVRRGNWIVVGRNIVRAAMNFDS
jgi:hypothetical protein